MTDSRVFYPAMPVRPVSQPVAHPAGSNSVRAIPFQDFLKNELTQVKFSQHALQRMKSRNIQLGQAEIAKLSEAVDKVAQKGARESLIMLNSNLALVVSIKNRTVITAMDGASMKENVFTNIDSAVII